LNRLDVLECVSEVVQEAGKIALESFGHSRVVFEKARASVATEADLRVEKHLIDFLRKKFPEHGILAEETGKIDAESEYLWIIDPIDGTRYYARGIPIYSISVALKEKDELTLGIIHFPSFGEIFRAAREVGVWRNQEAISCGRVTDPKDALVSVEIPARHDSAEERHRALELVQRMVGTCQRVRIIGLSSFSMCQVAHGGFDAYVNLGSAAKEWDLAAGKIITAEAGATVTEAKGVLVVANPILNDALLGILGL